MNLEKHLKRLILYVCDNEATQSEQDCFRQFVRHLKGSRKVRFIFRGESKLDEHYNTNLGNIPVLCHHIFILGCKGKDFFREKYYCDEKNVFQFIWDKFNGKVCELNFDSARTKDVVTRFFENNPDIKCYFTNDRNRESFIGFNNNHLSKEIADYYFALLHAIQISDNTRSYFLSSSTNMSVANEFKDNGIIIYGWVPRKGLKDKVIEYQNLDVINNELILPLGLPIYNKSVYPEQKEICLKCGMPPHFIIGFQHKNKFFINPHILSNTRHDRIISDGLDINQDDFLKVFNKSNYKSSYVFFGGRYYILSKDNVSTI